MINRITIENFKCFKKASFDLGNLNVLSGLNGTGKSTMIQSLLLPIQTCRQKMLNEALVLNGDLVKIGNGSDLLCEYADYKKVQMAFRYNDNEEITFSYDYKNNSSFLPVEKLDGDLESFNSVLDNIQYINALRIVPQSVYPKSDYTVLSKRQIGNSGEFSIQYLSAFAADEITNKSVLLNHIPEKFLKNQLVGWFDKIVPNTQLDFKEHDNTELISLKYRFRISDTDVSNYYRPTNVGFGLTYTLPVILALLKASKNDIVIIENPEAHLHPAGQRKMGELISLASAGGVQVIVETHSDHVLNGIRLSVKREMIEPSEVKILFFDRTVEGNEAKHLVHTPEIFTDGRLSFWPEGFFDEWDKAVEELF